MASRILKKKIVDILGQKAVLKEISINTGVGKPLRLTSAYSPEGAFLVESGAKKTQEAREKQVLKYLTDKRKKRGYF